MKWGSFTRKDLEAILNLVDYDDSGIVEIEARCITGRRASRFARLEELLYGMVQVSAELRPMRGPQEDASRAMSSGP